MDCGVFLGFKPCAPEQDGAVTHGVCPECRVKFLYPDLYRRMMKAASRFDLVMIQLFELPQIDHATDRHALANILTKEFFKYQ